MNKYVYDIKGEYIGSFFYEIENEDILKAYPNSFILNEYIEFSKIEEDKIISMSKEEIEQEKFKRYKASKYNLKSNEIIQEDKIKEIELKDYEYIEDGILKFNYAKKREDLLGKSKLLEEEEKEKSFEYKGYLQPNRELEDQTSLLKIISFLKERNQTSFDKWKMKDKEGHEHYISLTLPEMVELSVKMIEQTTKAMIKWSNIREEIKAMGEEELKEYKLEPYTP